VSARGSGAREQPGMGEKRNGSSAKVSVFAKIGCKKEKIKTRKQDCGQRISG